MLLLKVAQCFNGILAQNTSLRLASRMNGYSLCRGLFLSPIHNSLCGRGKENEKEGAAYNLSLIDAFPIHSFLSLYVLFFAFGATPGNAKGRKKRKDE